MPIRRGYLVIVLFLLRWLRYAGCLSDVVILLLLSESVTSAASFVFLPLFISAI